jgi:hypothetical protein
VTASSYLVPGSDPIRHRNITELEYKLLFSNCRLKERDGYTNVKEDNADFGLTHNDFNESNIIVRNDKIIGVLD